MTFVIRTGEFIEDLVALFLFKNLWMEGVCTKIRKAPTGCLLNIVDFSLKCCDFSELCQFCCSAGVLPAI